MFQLTPAEADACAVELKRLFKETFLKVTDEGQEYDLLLHELGKVIEDYDFARVCQNPLCGKVVTNPNTQDCVCRDRLPNKTQSKLIYDKKIQSTKAKSEYKNCRQAGQFIDPDFKHVRPTLESSYEPEFINDDPFFYLPNSKITCVRLLRDLGKRLGIKRYVENGQKNFAILACEGQPYGLIRNIIRNNVLCSICKGEFEIGVFSEHNGTAHDGAAEPDFEFSWVLLHLGYGHLQINYMKTVM